MKKYYGQIRKMTIEVLAHRNWCVLQFNSLIFHKYCVQLKNHYNKSILSSQRNMIFMLQYTFHKSQYSAKRNNNIIIVYDVISEWNGKEEIFFFIWLYIMLLCIFNMPWWKISFLSFSSFSSTIFITSSIQVSYNLIFYYRLS